MSAVIIIGLVSTMLVLGQGTAALTALAFLSALTAIAMLLRPAPSRAPARARADRR